MGLIVYSLDIRYIRWLVRYIQLKLLASINRRKLIPFQMYFDDLESGIDVFTAVKLAINSINLSQGVDCYHIYLDNQARYPKTNIRLVDIVKVVNYGTLTLRGYSIITTIFDDVTTNPDDYYLTYLKERGMVYGVRRAIR